MLFPPVAFLATLAFCYFAAAPPRVTTATELSCPVEDGGVAVSDAHAHGAPAVVVDAEVRPALAREVPATEGHACLVFGFDFFV